MLVMPASDSRMVGPGTRGRGGSQQRKRKRRVGGGRGLAPRPSEQGRDVVCSLSEARETVPAFPAPHLAEVCTLKLAHGLFPPAQQQLEVAASDT
eukprot:3707139-Rhodomonas_salina.1